MQPELVDVVLKPCEEKCPHFTQNFFKIQTFMSGKVSSGDLYFIQHNIY